MERCIQCDNNGIYHKNEKEFPCNYCLTGQLQAENGKLKEFARYVIRVECWSYIDQDGGDIQELAEKLGLIQQHTAAKDDVDDESDFEVGDTIYKFSDILKGDSK